MVHPSSEDDSNDSAFNDNGKLWFLDALTFPKILQKLLVYRQRIVHIHYHLWVSARTFSNFLYLISWINFKIKTF